MGKFLRFALMFGPMIYKGIKKMMVNRNSQNQVPPVDPSEGDGSNDQ